MDETCEICGGPLSEQGKVINHCHEACLITLEIEIKYDEDDEAKMSDDMEALKLLISS